MHRSLLFPKKETNTLVPSPQWGPQPMIAQRMESVPTWVVFEDVFRVDVGQSSSPINSLGSV